MIGYLVSRNTTQVMMTNLLEEKLETRAPGRFLLLNLKWPNAKISNTFT